MGSIRVFARFVWKVSAGLRFAGCLKVSSLAV